MSDLFDYVDWRGDITFDEVPFNKVDALMFAQLCYLNFNGIVPRDIKTQKTLAQVSYEFMRSEDFETRKDMGLVINKRTPELLQKVGDSVRYQNVLLSGYIDYVDSDKTEQFSAMLFTIGDMIVVAYRGTDDTIVGWKEDFNMAWLNEIPSQKDAIEYFQEVAKSFRREKFIIVGHSKGGNLAVNTAAKVPARLHNRIISVYNFDGTGFPAEFFKSSDFSAIKDKIYTYYPGFCMVGMLFYHPENYQIINSNGFAVLQHDPLTWNILGGSFIKEMDFAVESKGFHKDINGLMDRLDVSEREKLITSMFDVIEASGAKTNRELSNNILPGTKRMLDKYKSLDKKTKDEVHELVVILASFFQNHIPILKLLSSQK